MSSAGRKWNLAIEAGFLITVTAFLSYYFVFVRFPLTRDFPWLNLLLFAAGLGLSATGVVRAFRSPERYRGKVRGPLWAALGALIFGSFIFLTFWYARQVPASAGAPAVGSQIPDFTLPDSAGRPVTLSSLHNGKWVLLLFYRGYW
jgi:hypothetical protein